MIMTARQKKGLITRIQEGTPGGRGETWKGAHEGGRGIIFRLMEVNKGDIRWVFMLLICDNDDSRFPADRSMRTIRRRLPTKGPDLSTYQWTGFKYSESCK